MTVQPTRDQLRALANAATPGPWRVEYDNEDDYEQGIASGPFPSSLHGPESLTKWDDPRWQAEYGHQVSEVSDMRAEDAEFIAAARTAVPQLLDQLDQAEARTDRWRDYGRTQRHRADDQENRAIRAVANLDAARARAEIAEARIQAVRDVHTGAVWPGVADKPICDACDQMWPCATIRALEG